MRITFQASFFADLASIDASPANTLNALQALAQREIHVIPSTVTEINPTLPGGVSRLRFTSQDSSFEILVGRQRLDVIARALDPDKDDLGSAEDFANKVDLSLDAIIADRKINGTRLAFISATMSPAYNKKELDTAYPRLFIPPVYFCDNTPFEWTFRSNARGPIDVSGNSEPCNTILKVERTQGAIVLNGTPREFDRIITEIDINTAQENVTPRFIKSDMKNFVLNASQIETNLCEAIFKQFEGRQDG